MAEHTARPKRFLGVNDSVGRGPTGRAQAPGPQRIEHPQDFIGASPDTQVMNDRVLQHARRIDEEQTAERHLLVRIPHRSEERRVGKEWRSRWAAEADEQTRTMTSEETT